MSFDRSQCQFYEETGNCIYCYIEHCPACSLQTEKDKKENNGLFIFQVDRLMSPERLDAIRRNIEIQIEGGLVLLPEFVKLVSVLPSGSKIKIIDKDGNEVKITK